MTTLANTQLRSSAMPQTIQGLQSSLAGGQEWKSFVCSGGMSAQFRRTIDLEWHYMEAHYGKGPMNSVGGTVKNR